MTVEVVDKARRRAGNRREARETEWWATARSNKMIQPARPPGPVGFVGIISAARKYRQFAVEIHHRLLGGYTVVGRFG